MFAEVFDRQLACFEVLRRIGFDAEELFVTYNSGKPCTVVKADGKQFVILVEGPCTVENEAEFITEWTKVVEWWNGPATNPERMGIFHSYFDEAKIAELIFALDDKGLQIRNRSAQAVVGPRRN